MSKLAIIFCAVLFASAANASYASDKLASAQETLNDLLKNTIAQVRATVDDAKSRAHVLTVEIEAQADDYKRKIGEEVALKLQRAVEEIEKLTESVTDVDVSECAELKNHLQVTAKSALVEMKQCFVDKRDTAAGYLNNMLEVSNAVLDRLNVLKLDARGCIEEIDGLFSSAKALLCTNVVAGKAVWATAKAMPSITVEVMKLTFLLSTLPPSLTYCTATSALSTFYYESSVTASRTQKCIQQKIDEFRKATRAPPKNTETVGDVDETTPVATTPENSQPEADRVDESHDSSADLPDLDQMHEMLH